MPIPVATLPGVYDAIVTYQNHAQPQYKWRNTYTFRSTTIPSPGDGITSALSAYIPTLADAAVDFVKVSVYNWARGRQPYPLGSPIFTVTGVVPCTGRASWGAGVIVSPTSVAGEVVMRIDHEPLSGGKPGRNFIRGLLDEQDVTSVHGGIWEFITPSNFTNTALQAILASSGMTAHFGGATGFQFVIVRYSPKTGVVHGSVDLSGFTLIGVTTNRQTRKSKK